MISVWTGREANALREAMRLSIDEFANHTQVSRRSVAQWSSRGSSIRLRWDVQRCLDRVLAEAGDDVRDRLQASLASRCIGPGGGTPTRAVTSTAGAVVDEWAELLTTLIDPPDQAGELAPPPLIHLELAVAKLRMAYQACRYTQALGRLPGLMRLLLPTRSAPEVTVPRRVRKLASEACHVAAGLLLKLDDLPLAMLAAQRCVQEAQASGRPLARAAGERVTVRVLLRSGHADAAAALAIRAATRVAAATGLDGPRPLSAYGALLLRGALAHARLGDRLRAAASLRDADEMAQQLGRDGNFGWTAFGPTNVALHRMAVALTLGDPVGALRAVGDLDPDRIMQVERQAAYYVGTATAQHRLGHRAEAARALRRVAVMAPDEVRMRASTKRLADELSVTVPVATPGSVPAPSASRPLPPPAAAAP